MKTCRKGHERDESILNCPVCRQARYLARREQELESNRCWIRDNKARYQKKQKEYKESNPDQVKQWYKEWSDSHPVHSVYRAMINRCYSPRNSHYKNYGGRGISVCDRWLGDDGYKNFEVDMGPRPSLQHTIDRYPDNNGNYEPCNTRWASKVEQQRNRRANRLLTINGVTKCVAEWSEESGVCWKTLWKRVEKGWPEERLLSPPIRKVDGKVDASAS